MRMPVLSSFLDAKGRQLRGLAVNEIGRAMAAAALSEGMDSLSGRLAAIGLSEIAEGISELEAADALLDARDDAVSSGIDAGGERRRRAVRGAGRGPRHAPARRRRDGDGDAGRRGGRGRRRAEGRRGARASATSSKPAGQGRRPSGRPRRPPSRRRRAARRAAPPARSSRRWGRPGVSRAAAPSASDSSSAPRAPRSPGAGRTRSRSRWRCRPRGGRRASRRARRSAARPSTSDSPEAPSAGALEQVDVEVARVLVEDVVGRHRRPVDQPDGLGVRRDPRRAPGTGARSGGHHSASAQAANASVSAAPNR